MTVEEKSLSLPDQFKTAMELVVRVRALKVIKTKQEYDAANEDYRTLIANEKKLKIQWDELEVVVAYNKAYEQYAKMKADFASAKKYIKDSPMKAYDDEQERIRQAEEKRLAEIARKEAEAETARLVAEQKRVFDLAQAEAKRLEKIAAAAAAKQKAIDDAEYARLKKEGDKKAAEDARKAAGLAAAAAKLKADQDAQAALDRAEAARAEAAAIKTEAAAAPAPVVLVEKSHQGVSRRKVYSWRLTARDGRQFTSESIKASDRIGRADAPTLPPHVFVVSDVLLNDYVKQQGESAAIAGVLEVTSKMV
jgi:hypothetical protein